MPKTGTSGIPKRFGLRLGNMGVLRGNLMKKVDEVDEDGEVVEVVNRLSLYSWDVVQECSIKQCPAYVSCPLDKAGKCGVMMQYLRATSAMFFNNFAHKLGESEFYRIGMHMMPLYRMLCKLKIAEVGAVKVVISGVGGRKYINPRFREVRDTIKLIESLWTNIGLSPKTGVEPNGVEVPKHIDDDYYSMLEGDHVLTRKERNLLKKSKGLVRR